MKKNILILFLLLIGYKSYSYDINVWTGSTSSNWGTPSNWQLNRVPTTNDIPYIYKQPNQPVIFSGTIATPAVILVSGVGTILTINSGGTLRGYGGAGALIVFEDGGKVINNGTILDQNSSGGAVTDDFVHVQGTGSTTTFENNGTITINTNLYGFSTNGANTALSIVNTGTINFVNGGSNGFLGFNDQLNITNSGTIIYNSSDSNPNFLRFSKGTLINNSCGKIFVNNGGYFSSLASATATNNGLIQIEGTLNTVGTFTNSGVLNYTSLTGTITKNNGSVIVNNNATSSTIFTYQGTFGGTVNGIFTNTAATTSAGTFTAPNTFTPSGSLPTGSQTLYAKITPSGGACNYVVPFIFNNIPPPSFTTQPISKTVCSGSATSFTAVASNATSYQWQLSTNSGSTYSNLSNSGVYSNVSSTTLNISNVSGFNNYRYRCVATNAGGSTNSNVATLTISDITLTAGAVTNPTTCGGTGSIAFTSTNLPNGTYTLNYTLNGSATSKSITVSANAFSLTALLAGSYNTFSITNAGCTGTTGTLSPAKIVADPAAPTLTAGAITQPTTCGGTGSIAFTSTNLPNGTYTLNYTLNGSATSKSITVASNAFSLTALLAGSYNTFSITNAGCTGTTGTLNPAKIVADPASPTLTAGAVTNPTTCGGTGSIAFTSTNLPNGTYTLNYTLNGSATSKSITVSANAFSLTALLAGSYNTFSITNVGCTGTTGTLNPAKIVADPASPTLTAGTITQPTTCGGTGSITFTSTNLPNGTYTLNYTLNGSATSKSITVASNAFSLTALLAGSYNTFSITNAGCTGTTGTLTPAKIVADPTSPTLTAGAITQPTTCGGTGSIAFTSTNLPNGTYSLSFTRTGTGATASPQNISVSGNTFSLNSLKAGTYSNFSLISAGCTGSTSTAKTLSDPPTPTLSAGTSVNPSTCGGTNGSIPFTTTNLPNGNYTLTFMGAGSPKTITVANNAFIMSGLSAGGYSNFSITNNGCIGINAVSRALSDPTPPVLMLGTSTNPTACNLSDGTISFTVTNVSDGIYSLTYSGTGSPKNIMVTSGAFTLTGLPDGVFSNFSITNSGGCTGSLTTSVTLVDLALPTLTAETEVNPTTCTGTNGSIPFTTTNLPDGVYSLSFTSTGTVSPQNINVSGNAFILSGLSTGTYSNFSVTRSGCTGTLATSRTLIAPASPTLTAGTTENPSTCSGTDGSIAFTTDNLPNGTYSLSFNSTGTSSPINVIVTNNTFTLSGLSKGNYSNFSITNDGCTGTDETLKTLSDPATITITAGTITNPSTCSGMDGSITFSSINLPNGTYSLTYTATGTGATAGPQTVTITENLFTLTGLSAGTYNNFSIVYLGCTALDATSKTLTSPAAPTLIAGIVTNPTTCLSSDGTIAFTTTLPNGTYSLNYTGLGSPQTITVLSGAFTLANLSDGTFSNFSITNNGCTSTDASVKILTDPAAPTLTAGAATNPTTCSGTNGSIAFTTSLANGTYTLNYTGSGSPQTITVLSGAFTLANLPAGNYSGFSVTTGGCTGTSSATKTLTDPAAPTLTAGTATNPATCSGTDGSIAFTTSLANGIYSLTYSGTGSPQNIMVVSGAFTLSSLSAGTYGGFSITIGGCTATSSDTKTLNDPIPPTILAGTITNPSTCGGANGSIAFSSTNLPNGTFSLSFPGTGSPKNVTVASGVFTLSGLMAGNYSNFIITNVGCTGMDASSKILTDPTLNAPTASGTTISSGSMATLSATCSAAGDVKWYDASMGGNVVSTANSFTTPTLTTNTDYYVACEVAGSATCISTRTQVTVTVIANRVYVNIANANPTQDGISWATAYSNLQTALTTATTGFEIWVAQGTYKPTSTITRTIYFNIPNAVKVYGGFVGTETVLNSRNFRTNITILSGDIGVVNVTSDNSYHVVTFDGSSTITVLDGFTITGGNANFDSRRVGSSTANPSTTTIETGGGIVVQNASSPMITNCTIVNNAAVTGGGIYVGDASLPKIMACKIMANQATFGGGISFQDGSNGSLNNTLLSGNRGIGGVYNNSSNPTITNCTIAGNGGYNGGIFNSNSQPVVKNTIIWGNSAPFNDTQSIITYSNIQGGYAGTGNVNYDPKFVSPVPDGLSPTINGDYHMQASSLANDRGDNTGISLIDTDLDGNLRRYNGGIVDMGAYEFQGAATANIIISAQTGDWESNSTWIGLKVPALGDVVIIDANHIVTINTNATAKSIEYRATGQVKFKTASAQFNIGF